jgi:phosphoglycolate phosphatase-like HAD superfamily hydrolase
LSLVLFDIDGTLLLTGGAGVRAMTRAFEATFGIRDAFDGISVAGRTDTYLLSQALQRSNTADSPENHERFRRAYVDLLAGEILQPGHGRRGLMPGVDALLVAMHQRQELHIALLTGNYEHAARIKLGHFNVGEYFAWGVFGEESADRNELGRIAITRAQERSVPVRARAQAVVIGDTPHDVECAHAAGMRALAVATGSYSVSELEATGADVVLPDLSDVDGVLAFVGG